VQGTSRSACALQVQSQADRGLTRLRHQIKCTQLQFLGSARAARSVVVLPTPTGLRRIRETRSTERSRRTHQRSARRRRRPRRQKARRRPRPAPGQPVAIVSCRLGVTSARGVRRQMTIAVSRPSADRDQRQTPRHQDRHHRPTSAPLRRAPRLLFSRTFHSFVCWNKT